uniref:Uncharacterized protein n=1 Tax=Polytomella parva TaxID=51329 RepID=A0A7S0V937_9CHLO
MAIFGIGRKKENKAPAPVEEEVKPVEVAPTPQTMHSEPSSSIAGLPHTNLLKDVSPDSNFMKATSFASLATDATSNRVYNPYEGLSSTVGAKPHSFVLPSGPEFVFEEEAAVRRRGWSENMQFYVGMGYLLGGAGGITGGIFKTLTTKSEVTHEVAKLKMNRLLNNSGALAKPLSNGGGLAGLFFSLTESYLLNHVEEYGVPDYICTTAAGIVAGSFLRLPRGPRQMVVAGALGGVAGVAISGLRTVFPSL